MEKHIIMYHVLQDIVALLLKVYGIKGSPKDLDERIMKIV